MTTGLISRVTETFVLPKDVEVRSVNALPANEQHDLPTDHFVITRPRARSMSGLLSPQVAVLLRNFGSPTTIVDAIVQYCAETGLVPEAVLEDSYSAIRSCIQEGFLVPSDSPLAEEIGTSLEPGEEVDDFEIVECVALLEDTEVYKAVSRQGATIALKLLRSGASEQAKRSMHNELSTLPYVPSPPAARLISHGEHAGRPYVAIDWINGDDLGPRRESSPAEVEVRLPIGLLERCANLIDAFAALHTNGIVHGDVHPGNILFESDHTARVIDFGFARRSNDHAHGGGGTLGFQAPETLTGQVDQLSEQFAVGAVLFRMLTGHTYVVLDVDLEEAHRQMLSGQPRSFASMGLPPWPDMERILARALSVNPQDRFSSIAEFGEEFRSIVRNEVNTFPTTESDSTEGTTSANKYLTARVSPEDALIDCVIERYGNPNRIHELQLDSPSSSVFYGAAGLSVALCRLGLAREDLDLIHAAELWNLRASRAAELASAWTSDDLEINESVTGTTSPYHRMAGVAVVAAEISTALGNTTAVVQAHRDFVRYSIDPATSDDQRLPELTLGPAGTLLCAAELVDLCEVGLQRFDRHLGTSSVRTELGIQTGNANECTVTYF
jgi:eukaryotic-like serine/threonine-protein kinase